MVGTIVLLPLIITLFGGGYAWVDMDWNRDGGSTSLGEVFDSTDVGTRPSFRDPACTEFFWLTDGSPIYERCPKR